MQRQHGAFINARYSTDNQNPDSIDVQVSKCTQYCNQHGIPILGVFADEAVSGIFQSTLPVGGATAKMHKLTSASLARM